MTEHLTHHRLSHDSPTNRKGRFRRVCAVVAALPKRTRHVMKAAGAFALVGGTLGGLSAVASAQGPDPAVTPFLQSGNNGFPKPNGGAAVFVDEGSHGQGVLLTSISGAPNEAGYGLAGLKAGKGTTVPFSSLSDVQTQYAMTQGTCGGGAPRWIVDLHNPSNPSQTASLLVYFGTQPYGGCSGGAQQEPNIMSDPTTAWWVNNGNTPQTTSSVESTYGSWTVDDIEIVVDAGWDQATQLNPNIQQVLLQKTTVNGFSLLPLPS